MKNSKILFLLSILLIASLVLVGCGSDGNGNGNGDDSGDTGGDVTMDYPFKNPGNYVYATFGEPESMDPHWTYETTGSGLQASVYEQLITFEREKTDVFVPMLATSWESNAVGDVWTFTIREGVTFHEGGTLEPHDVAYSFARALLQDRIDGPHWMTHEMFFGTYGMLGGTADSYAAPFIEAEALAAGIDTTAEDYEPRELTDEELVGACEYVKSAAVADDAAGTVTFTMEAPAPWFLAVMAQGLAGAVMDQEWMTENGGWDGDCATWLDYNDPADQDSILFNVANGTGPFVFDHWTPGEEIVLVRNENYWRAEDNPIWEGGPSGLASLERFTYLVMEEWGTRLATFEAGDADSVTVSAEFNSQVEPMYGEVNCVDENHKSCVDAVAGGWIQAYVGIQRPVMTPAQFNQQINSEGGNMLQGSGELDGNGIPDDFFQDEHIRRAFSYCFDYDTAIQEALDGEGAQAQGPIIDGMMGYRDDGYVYSYDLDKCAEEFQLSDSGVWDTGFYMQMAYNTGNTTRSLAAEILKAGIEEVNDKFQIVVVSMPWPVLLNSRRAGKLPIYVGGWAEDFHDPHNWVHPFLHSTGAYGRVANFEPALAAEFDAMIEAAAAASGAEARTPLYEALQLKAQEEAVMVWMYQPLVRYHFSPWIEGWYFNAAYSMPAFQFLYGLEKVGP